MPDTGVLKHSSAREGGVLVLTGPDGVTKRVLAGPLWARHESGVVAVYDEVSSVDAQGNEQVEERIAGKFLAAGGGAGSLALRADGVVETALLDGGSYGPQGSLLLLAPAQLAPNQAEDWTAFLGFGREGPMLALSDGAGRLLWLDITGLHALGVEKESNFVEPIEDGRGLAAHYCVVEAPEVGVQLRGTAELVAGRAEVHLAKHFGAVASAEQLTVQLTPRSAMSKGVAATALNTRELVIEELAGGCGNYSVDWFIQGVRKGREGFVVLRPWSGPPMPAPARSGKKSEE